MVVSVVTLCWISICTGCHKNDARSDELSKAASRGDAAKVQALLKADPSLISSKDSHGNTPLHFAVLHGHLDVAELLLASGADATGISSTLGQNETLR